MSPSQLDTPGKPAEIDWKRLRNFLLEQWGVKDEELPRDPKKLSELTSVRLRGAGSGREGEPFPKDFPDLEALKGLVSIKAEGVKINSRPLERVLSRFPQLTTISLKNCGLSKWPNFQQKSTALREIDLSGNGISTLPPSVGALSELRKLDLSDNNLRSLPLGIKLLNNLQELRVRGNPLKELPFYPDALAIAKCDLTQAWNEANPKAPKPASGAYPGEASSAKANGARQDGSKAGAADSATATAAPTPLKKAQTAEESGAGPTDPAEKPNESEPTRASKNPGADAGIAVDAENAALRDFLTKTWKVDPDFLPEADKIGQVTALSMRRERGSVDSNPPDADAAPESIKRLSGLKTLRLEGFVARHPRSISKILDLFPNLESLSLIRCNLPDVPQSALGLSRLVFLDLSGNNLYRLPKSFGDLQKLRFLKLTGNNLTGVPALFRRMPALEAIDLSRNKVLSFPDAVKDRIKPLPRIAVERMRWDMGCALPDSSEEAPKQAPSAPRAEPAPSAKERAEEAIQEEGKFVKVVGSSPSGQRIPLKAAKQLPEQRQRPAEDPKSQAGAEASQARANEEQKAATPATPEQPAPKPAQAQTQAQGADGDKAQAEHEAAAPAPTPDQPEQSEQTGPEPNADGEQKTATPATQKQLTPEQTPAPAQAQAQAQAQGAEDDKALAAPEASAPAPSPAQPEQSEQAGPKPIVDGEQKTATPTAQEQSAPEQTPAPAQSQAQGAEGDKAEAVPEASAPAPTPAQPEQSEQSGPEPAGGEAQPQRHAAPSDEELTVQPGPATSPNETPAGAGGNAAPPASVGQARPAPIEGAPSPDEALTVEFAPASAPEPTPAAEPEPAANGAKSEIGPEANVETPTEKKEERKAGKEEEAEEKQAPAKQTPKGENAGASPAEAAPKPDRRDWMRPKTELSVEVGPSRVKPKNAFSLFKPFSASPYAHRYRSFYDNPAQALHIAPAGGLAAYVYGFNESSPDFNARREKELTAGVETLLIDEGNRDRMLALLPAMESLKTLVLETDDVPEEIRLAPQLEKLYIRIPLLESLPNAIGAMVNLKRLSITQHRLDSLPDSFSRLESLESLDLRTDFGARYRFLPSNVLLLPKLKTLKIGSFAFVGPYGAEIPDLGGRVPSVERLIVSKCSIGEAPPRFERLGALKILELNGGDLYGGLDWLHLGEMPELRELRLIDLPCSALPAGLAELKNLERLVLSRLDKIDDFGEGLGELSALRELVVDRCPAPALPLGIARLERLRSLTIRGCPNLRKLPAGLTALKNLRELCAVDSGLTALPDRIWDMPSLRKLDASGNQIGYLPDDLSRSRSLRDVDVSGNPFDNPFKELEKLLPLLSRLNAPAAGVGPLKAPNPAVWGRIGKGDALALEPENAEALREFGEELGLRFGFEGARAFGALGAVRELSLSVAPDGRDWTALGRLFPRVEKLNLLRYAHGPRQGDFAPPSAFPSVKELWLYCQDSEPCPLPEGLGDMPFLRALRLTVPHGLDGESSKMLGRLSQEGALKAETLTLDGKWDSAPPDFVRGMTGVKALDMHDAGARFAAPWLSEWDNLEAARLKLKGSPQDIQPLLTHPGLKRVSLCVTSWDKAWDELFDGDWVERCGWEFLEIFADRIGKIGAGLARMRSLRNLRLDAKSIGVVEEGALNGPSLETLDAQGPAIGDAPNALVSYRLALAKGEKISWGDCRRERKAKPAR